MSETRRAHFVGKEGPIHFYVVDEKQQQHWLMRSQFDDPSLMDLPRNTKVTIESRAHSWHVVKKGH